MKLAIFNTWRVGIVEDDQIFDVTSVVPNASPRWPLVFVNQFIDEWEDIRDRIMNAKATIRPRPLAQVQLCAPIPNPQHLIAAPANYRKHIGEMGKLGSGGRSMAQLGFFLKSPSSLTGPNGPVILPRSTDRRFDHEAELGVIIARRCKNVPLEEAMDVVFGYTCLLDMTMRISDEHQEERVMRKSFDTFTPTGPWIVTADEIENPQELSITLKVNGDVRQSASTADMILSVAEQISYISSVMTLSPGDVLATGTPEGIGPIQKGDVIDVQISGVGEMKVTVEESDVVAPKTF
jgi:2-keto-4-pentenoate hydratase/2-oxohepta-3-ene-1,7-dioic acid hydratase in catechol pathway